MTSVDPLARAGAERPAASLTSGGRRLRVLLADERCERLELTAQVVGKLGHEVIARESQVAEVQCGDGAGAAGRLPGRGWSVLPARARADRADRQRSTGPVITMLSVRDPAFVREAAKRGVFAYTVGTIPEELQGAIDIAVRRCSEYQGLQLAFARRAEIEQAKGILMASHAIDADEAFGMLRAHSQRHGQKIADVGAAIVRSHLLLLPFPR